MENKINTIIGRVLSGSGSSEDILSLSEWLNINDENKEEFLRLKNYWEAEVSFNHSISPILSVEKLQQKIIIQQKKKKQKQTWFLLIPMAAAIALLIIVSSSLFLKQTAIEKQQFYTYATNNHISNITLEDGTQIKLNKDSRLTYTDKYDKGVRSVILEGEAYFQVAKDSLNPFEVIMGDASIKVLGTTFNVKADVINNRITATLIEGSIRFQNLEQQVVLTPSQMLVYHGASGQIEIKSIDVEETVAWKNGLLKYKSVSFNDLMNQLKQKYDVQIIIENKKWLNSDVTVSGTFEEEQSLEQILQVIARSLPIKWTKKDEIYYIK